MMTDSPPQLATEHGDEANSEECHPANDADSRAATRFATISTMFTIIVMFSDNEASQYIHTIGRIARSFQLGAF